MAKQVIVKFIDDIDGSDATEVIEFTIGSKSYEMDLSAENAEAFHEALRPYIDVARTVARTASRAAGRSRSTVTPLANKGEIRKWAAENGIEVSSRGRIPLDVVNAYNAENPQ